ncbi:MAG: type II secretion system GspH family protein [Patescibacteria group bacterium]|nr:type II secretion system GspH family protein [Patescibacteria group bacterium]
MDTNRSLAFTMIEMMITISIIALLTTIPVLAYTQISRNARDTKRKEHIDTVAAALQAYKIENDRYPEAGDFNQLATYLVPEYLSQLPVEPAGLNYTYESGANGQSFSLSAQLDSKNGDNHEVYVALPAGKRIITGAPPGAPTGVLSPTGTSPLQLTLTPRAATRTPTPVPSTTPTPVPTIQITPVSIPIQGRFITRGADNNMWITARSSDSGSGISRITNAGEVSSWNLSEPNTDPGHIFTGPDLNMWFAGSTSRISAITTSGMLTALGFDVPNSLLTAFTGIDENIWVLLGTPTNKMVKYAPTGSTLAEYSVTQGTPGGMVRGSDNTVWIYTLDTPNKVASLNNNSFTYRNLPGTGTPVDITSGVNANIWVGMNNGSIVKVSATQITEYTTGLTSLNAVARGNDRNTWFAGSVGGVCKIGRMSENGQAFSWDLPVCATDLSAGIGRSVWAVSSSTAEVYKIVY